MERERIPLNFKVNQVLKVGHLQTLARIQVKAGDSIELRSSNIVRLGALRRNLTSDLQTDYHAFYIPHRHIYGDDWINMMKEGVDSAITLPNVAVGGGCFYLGQTMDALSGSFSLDTYAGYNQVWNRFYRYPRLTPLVPDDYNGTGAPVGHNATNSPLIGDINMVTYGFNCARIKNPWTTGIVGSLTAADREVPSAAVVDLIDLERISDFYKTKVDREFKDVYYNDVMMNSFGSGVNTDADQRPTMIWKNTVELSGYDVDGTGDATLGQYAGKSIGSHNFGFPRKFIPEHGQILVVALVRFPTICTREKDPKTQSNQDYLSVSADERVIKNLPPVDSVLSDWMLSPAGATAIGRIPAAQEWRHQHNNINYLYEQLQGYPFLTPAFFNTHVKAAYVGTTDYDTVFQSTQLGHITMQAQVMCNVFRNFPAASESLYAGVMST